MPGKLRHDAECPVCCRRLVALVDETRITKDGNIVVVRELFHPKVHGPAKRMGPCVQRFRSYEKARAERRALEIPFAE